MVPHLPPTQNNDSPKLPVVEFVIEATGLPIIYSTVSIQHR